MTCVVKFGMSYYWDLRGNLTKGGNINSFKNGNLKNTECARKIINLAEL